MSSEFSYDLFMLARSKGLTLADIARRMQPPVTRSAVSGWANGAFPISAEKIEQIAAILQEDVSTIERCIQVGTTRRKGSNILSPDPPASAPGTTRQSDQAEARAIAI